MFKTIKSRMVFMYIIMMLVILGIIMAAYMAFFEDYYFARKMGIMKDAFKYLKHANLTELEHDVNILDQYREQGIKFIITDEQYQDVFSIGTTEADEDELVVRREKELNNRKIRQYIINDRFKYKETITLENKKYRICGYGIIYYEQQRYFVYMYETKQKMQIGFAYNYFFLLIVDIVAILGGIIVFNLISRKITKPIRELEEGTKEAIENSYVMPVRKEKSFVELESLSESINIMMDKIRIQMSELHKELERKTLVEEQRRQFVNNVSHEMKTPLAIISGQVEMLGFIEDEQKRQEYCKSIVDETQKMSQMINDMISSYKSDSGVDGIKFESLNIANVVRKACDKCSRLFEQNNIELLIEEQSDANVYANEHMVIQVVDNYLTNAVKHSKTGGEVHVRIIDAEEIVRIEVENNGPGIPDEDRDKIWDSFYTADTTETLNGQKGSGLGLAIVKNIMTIHHGEYGFDNLDNGIVFWISLDKMIDEE